MQHANCFVRLGGKLDHEIYKVNVTPAEVAVLQYIHGKDGVVKVQLTSGNDKTPHAAEAERLRGIYGAAPFEATFPGAHPQLPTTFGDIGVAVIGDEEPKRGRRKSADESQPEAATAE